MKVEEFIRRINTLTDEDIWQGFVCYMIVAANQVGLIKGKVDFAIVNSITEKMLEFRDMTIEDKLKLFNEAIGQ